MQQTNDPMQTRPSIKGRLKVKKGNVLKLASQSREFNGKMLSFEVVMKIFNNIPQLNISCYEE